ncbi:unnamed protein product [Ranitomeya imitator]|uniref:ribonuclease H n=1 Tax=Ranitomeya imitator TaxID=111125 RepID=A0ABN9LEM7_9NEOB|nr:unnamed protein product [Ranitomeya imitator]
MAMLDLGVIEESHSAWSSPIVLIPKPDGSIQFCNDFRKLNAVSKFDAYPMPRVDELIDRLGKARYITTLDLTKGYWQIPLAEAAREKTAFATPEGLFQYVYMPFGLHGAPATFQRLMDRVLRPHRQYASAYLDDIVIYSMDWETHLQKVQAVIDDLRDAGLTANPKKCHIRLEEARYLGYVIGRGVVKPQIDKIQAIQGWPQPVNKKQVQAFLGIAGYYRRFIPNFAAMATPLTDLTKGKGSVMVKWTSAAEEAFHSLKRALCSQPVLVTPDFSSEFVVQTDASDTGVGAVLSQVRDGVEHPVLYLSRKLNVHEQRYAVVEKECLAIKWALDSLKYYLAEASSFDEVGIIVGSSLGVLLVLLLLTAFVIYKRLKEKQIKHNPNKEIIDITHEDKELSKLRGLSNAVGLANACYAISTLPTKNEMENLPTFPRVNLELCVFLGSGAFGEVYQGIAKDILGPGTGSQKVAVKTLKSDATDEEKVEFLKEAHLMSQFHHPNILKLLGVCLHNEPQYIILELMDGGDLLSYLRGARVNTHVQESLSTVDLLDMSLDISTGCVYLEKMHFVHRDLAARNCLVSVKEIPQPRENC